MKMTVDLGNIGAVLDELQSMKSRLPKNTDEFLKRMSEIGVTSAEMGFATAQYDGESSGNTVRSRQDGPNKYTVRAEGDTVLFLEFGAGITYWTRYSEAEKNGMGPGTYPGQTRAFSPGGWYFYDSSGTVHHTYGNPPSMAMYNATKEIQMRAPRIAQEVFGK